MFHYHPTWAWHSLTDVSQRPFSLEKILFYGNVRFRGLIQWTLAERTKQPPADEKGAWGGEGGGGPGKALKEEMENMKEMLPQVGHEVDI